MGAIGARGLEVEPSAAVGKGYGAGIAERAIAVRRVSDRGLANGHERSVLFPSQAGPLEPVLGSGRSSVVKHGQWSLVQDCCDPGAARVPAARRAAQHDTMIAPMKTVHADRVAGDHPVLLPWVSKRMAAHPHPPARWSSNDHRIFNCPVGVTGEYQVTITERQLLGTLGVQCIDPPVFGVC